jgi:hypothetical protein
VLNYRYDMLLLVSSLSVRENLKKESIRCRPGSFDREASYGGGDGVHGQLGKAIMLMAYCERCS